MQNVLPNNIEAEQAVIAALILEPEKWDEVSDSLNEDHFYKSSHRKIFAALRDLSLRGETADIITLTEHLKKKDEMELAGGASYIAQILDQNPTTANLKSHVHIVSEKAILRKLISECQEVATQAYEEQFEDINAFLDAAEAKIFAIAEKKKAAGLVSAKEVLKQSMQRLDELHQRGGQSVIGVPSGFSDLDRMTAGFQPGELIIIAARPSMGKTALALNIAAHAAIHQGKKVALFSLEMSQEQLMLRVLASEAGLDMQGLRVGKIPNSAWPKLINTANDISKTDFYIDDTSSISPFEIRGKCRRLKAQRGLDMIMIDYLQLMDLKQKVESRERAVSEISKTLKAVARELKVPVIALSQLNRGVEGRSDRRPMLSDLRESGSIEQDADVIMMIYRDEYYEKENSDARGVAEVIVGKQRNGPTGTVKLAWLSQYGRFRDLAPESLTQLAPPQAQEASDRPKPRGPLPNFAPKV